MFTGLVEVLGEVAAVERRPPGMRLVIRSDQVADGTALGDSVSINGCCLTVVEIGDHLLHFDLGEETLLRTNLGPVATGDRVNLERSLRVGDRMGGHFVTGHVDCVAEVDERNEDGEWATFWFRFPAPWSRQMTSKGSVTVDGISLTLVDVESARFSVMLIPHTLEVTTLGFRQVGDAVNIETDVLAKYVQRLVEPDDS